MLLAIPFGLAIGIAVGMLGGGGSVLAVPVLVYVLGQSVSDATTASLVVVASGALAGGLGHARAGRVFGVLASIVSATSLLPILVAGPLADAISGQTVIAIAAVIVVLAAILSALLYGPQPESNRAGSTG